jgi:hypothetical protein
MNDIFREYLDHFVMTYLDDIWLFFLNIKKHTNNVRLVLAKFQEHGLYVKSKKCEFDHTSVELVVYIILTQGITRYMCKVMTIQEWAFPTRVREVQSFLSFANFYRRFMKAFLVITRLASHCSYGSIGMDNSY